MPNVTPDVFVELGDDGKYQVRLEDGRTPKLYISAYYRKMLMSDKANAETREYIKRKINSAQWLIESIEQRRNTLTRVAQAIVDHQTEFLNKGPEAIEPLKMQQIADKVGVHVTTVSRAVDDKWIQTPRGIFPLKRFFCGGTVSAAGEEVAWDAVRLKLQEIIDNENKQHPLSRRRPGGRTGQARPDRGPPHGHQVPQGDEHRQLPPAPRLEPRRWRRGKDAAQGRALGRWPCALRAAGWRYPSRRPVNRQRRSRRPRSPSGGRVACLSTSLARDIGRSATGPSRGLAADQRQRPARLHRLMGSPLPGLRRGDARAAALRIGYRAWLRTPTPVRAPRQLEHCTAVSTSQPWHPH